MTDGEYNPQSFDAVLSNILTEIGTLKRKTDSILSIVQVMQPKQQSQADTIAQLEVHCPALGGDGACQEHAEKQVSSPNWVKWLLIIAAVVGTALGWIPR